MNISSFFFDHFIMYDIVIKNLIWCFHLFLIFNIQFRVMCLCYIILKQESPVLLNDIIYTTLFIYVFIWTKIKFNLNYFHHYYFVLRKGLKHYAIFKRLWRLSNYSWQFEQKSRIFLSGLIKSFLQINEFSRTV